MEITMIKRTKKNAVQVKNQLEQEWEDLRFVCYTEQNINELEVVKAYVKKKLSAINEIIESCDGVLNHKGCDDLEVVSKIEELLNKFRELAKDPYLSRLEPIYTKSRCNIVSL